MRESYPKRRVKEQGNSLPDMHCGLKPKKVAAEGCQKDEVALIKLMGDEAMVFVDYSGKTVKVVEDAAENNDLKDNRQISNYMRYLGAHSVLICHCNGGRLSHLSSAMGNW